MDNYLTELPKISIVICTYNRSQILRGCLDSLSSQTMDSALFEVIIVDNNSSDDTREVVEKYCAEYPHFNYVLETNIGLSRARNTGFRNAKSDWILYLDDDVKVLPNLTESALNTIENHGFECFGGIIYTYYLKERPRWIKPDFLSNQYLLEKYPSPSIVTSEREIWGCLLVFRKDLLEKFGGFNPNLGMNGNKMGYFEETDMILNFKEAGYRIGIDPNMKLQHLIPNFKLQLNWHLKEGYVGGRDMQRYWKNYVPNDYWGGFIYILTRPLSYFRNAFLATQKLYRDENFYIENAFLAIVKPILNDVGKVVFLFRK
jgi:glucosyl-dolichyl phosphate glucuronosyltransferase